MNIDFYKIRIHRSDYLLIHPSGNSDIQPDKTGIISRTLCRRRAGVGANGLIVLWGRGSTDLKLEFFDRSGELEEAPGDALLCATRFAFDSGRVDADAVRFAVGTATRTVRAIDSSSFRIDLGRPVSLIDEQELSDSSNREYNSSILVNEKWVNLTPVRCRLDCAVIFGKISRGSMRNLDMLLREHVASEDMQPVFLRVLSPEEVRIHTWFHGDSSDFSATAAAAAVASVANGFSERIVSAHFGDEALFIEWNQSSNRVFVTGTPSYVFTGSMYIE